LLLVPVVDEQRARQQRRLADHAGHGLRRCAGVQVGVDRAHELIDRLGLQPHPERGYYVETYRASLKVDGLPAPFSGPHAAATAIYFLVTRAQPTTYLHRLLSDEIFHFYEGGPLDVLLLGATGAGEVRRLGTDVAGGQRPQIVIPAGTWFAA